VQILRITELEETPEARDARVRLCQQKADETSLTGSLVDGSPPNGTFTTLGKALLHGT
jgi:hypothetical protein